LLSGLTARKSGGRAKGLIRIRSTPFTLLFYNENAQLAGKRRLWWEE
jgi:hypothetical protein